MLLLLTLMHYKEVDAKKWQDIKKRNQTFVTLFFAPWCGHCKAFGPEYQKAGKKLTGILDFVSVDCTVESNQQLCGSQQIQGYPTVKIFNHAQGKNPKVYEGERSADSLSRWAMDLQKRPFTQLRGQDANVAASIPDEGDVLIMTTQSAKASALAFKIAKKYTAKATVICHVAFNEGAADSYDNTPFAGHIAKHERPQIVVRKAGKIVEYGGENQGEAIEAWLSEVFV